MSDIKFGYVISEVTPVEAIELGILAEKRGFDSIFAPDHMMDFDACRIDPWSVLSAIGALTRRLFLSPSVTDYQRCHPAKTAHIVATLDAITGGRAGLGIGSGEGMNTRPYGIEFEEPSIRIAKLDEAIRMIIKLWTATKNSPANYEGRYFKLVNAWLDQSSVRKPHPPIYLGAIGSSRLLELTGELADGWLPFMNTPETYAKRFEKVKSGVAKANRKIEDIDAVAMLFPSLSDAPGAQEKAVELCKIYLASEPSMLKVLGRPLSTPPDFAYQHTLISSKASSVVFEMSKQVPIDLAREVAQTSTDQITETTAQFIKAGATHIVFREIDRDPKATINKVAEKIMPYFRGN